MQIYTAKNGIQTGPFSENQLHGMLTGGFVSPSDLAWHDGLPDWQPLHTILGLRLPPPIPTSHPLLAAPPATVARPVGPTGVGGWLIFFCVGLTILSPLFVLGSMVYYWSLAEPAFIRFPAIKTAVLWENFGSIVLLIYGFIVGCIVWSGDSKGRGIARQFLLIQLFGLIGVELIALSIMMMGDLPRQVVASAAGAMVGVVFKSVVYFLVWWFYFKKSKRVKNTYGDERA